MIVMANARPMSAVNPYSPATTIQRPEFGTYRDSRFASCRSKNSCKLGRCATG